MVTCNKCYNHSCNGSCGQPEISRQIRLQNNSIGRDGETAYQIAVRLGFSGTEEEWIASLQGQDGAGIQLKGSVPLYVDLANIAPSPVIGDAWAVDEDGMLYVYGENGFPAKGFGILIQGIQGDSYIPIENSNYFDL